MSFSLHKNSTIPPSTNPILLHTKTHFLITKMIKTFSFSERNWCVPSKLNTMSPFQTTDFRKFTKNFHPCSLKNLFYKPQKKGPITIYILNAAKSSHAQFMSYNVRRQSEILKVFHLDFKYIIVF